LTGFITNTFKTWTLRGGTKNEGLGSAI
jgi:hypothetical protein